MKRRQFIQSLGASAAVAGMPIKTIAFPAASSVSYGMTPYKWAKYTARINKKLTPEMLRNFCGFSADGAEQMIRRLTAEKVLLAPDATGLSRTNVDYIGAFKEKQRRLKSILDQVDDILPDQSNDIPTENDADAVTETVGEEQETF